MIHARNAPTEAINSSFQAKKPALNTEVTWLEQNDDRPSASITSDCQSLLQALDFLYTLDPFLLSLKANIAVFHSNKMPS